MPGTEGCLSAGVRRRDPGRITDDSSSCRSRLALETDLAFGHLRISYQLTTVDGGRTRFQRDLDFPELGPQVSAAMQAQSADGITSLACLVQHEIPAPRAATTE